ncbi:MAG: hypothetical protein MUF58_19715 [Arcicella sp.]|jgi:hypothetical protein|nr:hypothetical protein [Arcicella sp.]
MAISGVPNKKKSVINEEAESQQVEKKIQEWIKRGGSTTNEVSLEQPEQDPLKAMNIKLYQSELEKIKDIRGRTLKRDRLSIHDWILQAIHEKIEKEF